MKSLVKNSLLSTLSVVVVLTGLAVTANAETLSAQEIMEKVDARDTGETSQGETTMILIDKRGRERVRQMKLYSLDQTDVERSVTYFLSPADVKGTGYLSFDWETEQKEDDSWLYLPALKQVNRIAAGDKSNSFMGSDFTYSDINGVNIDWYDYKFISESETVDGAETWLIESTPKPDFLSQVESETGYTKSHLWIRKDNFVQVQAKIWVKKGKRVKFFSARDLELIDGIWTPKKLQMITTRNGKKEHASVLEINSITYNQPLEESLFSKEALQRGLGQ